MNKKLLYSGCVILGLVLVVTGLEKIVDTATFGNLIVQYGFKWAHPLAPLIALIQVGIGLCLILNIRPKIMALVASVLLVGFTLVFSYAYFVHGVTDCGCSEVLKAGTGILFFYVRNTLLFGLALFVGLYYPESQEKINSTKNIILVGMLLPMTFVAGFSYKFPAFLQSNDSHPLLNKHISKTPLSRHIQTVSDSSYLVFFHQHNCPHCWNSLGNLKEFKNSGRVNAVVSFAIVNPDLNDSNNSSENTELKNAFLKHLGDIETCTVVLDSVRSFIRAVPTSFYIKNDTIRSVVESILPHPFIFRIQSEY